MKIYIWDLAFGNCRKGIHKFENFLLDYFPPPIVRDSHGISPDEYGRIFSKKKYEIRCKNCGKKAE